MIERFGRRFYSVRPNLLGTKLTVTDRHGAEILFVPIKNLGHSSEINVFPDKNSKDSLLIVRPVYPQRGKGWLAKVKHFISGPTHHDVIDFRTGSKIGALRLEIDTRNPKDQKWVFMDVHDGDFGHLEPMSGTTWGAKFEHSGFIGDRPVCHFKSRNIITGRSINVDLALDANRELDARLAVAAAVKMAVDMVNLASD